MSEPEKEDYIKKHPTSTYAKKNKKASKKEEQDYNSRENENNNYEDNEEIDEDNVLSENEIIESNSDEIFSQISSDLEDGKSEGWIDVSLYNDETERDDSATVNWEAEITDNNGNNIVNNYDYHQRFIDYMLNEIAIPVRDGHSNFYGIETEFYLDESNEDLKKDIEQFTGEKIKKGKSITAYFDYEVRIVNSAGDCVL